MGAHIPLLEKAASQRPRVHQKRTVGQTSIFLSESASLLMGSRLQV